MRTLLTRRAGSPGTKKLLSRYGSDLVCVRYRYDAAMNERVKTVELIVERVAWKGRSRKTATMYPEVVRLRLRERETLLRRAILLGGGKWDEGSNTWLVNREVVIGLGLESRILRPPRKRAERGRSTSRSARSDPSVNHWNYR